MKEPSVTRDASLIFGSTRPLPPATAIYDIQPRSRVVAAVLLNLAGCISLLVLVFYTTTRRHRRPVKITTPRPTHTDPGEATPDADIPRGGEGCVVVGEVVIQQRSSDKYIPEGESALGCEEDMEESENNGRAQHKQRLPQDSSEAKVTSSRGPESARRVLEAIDTCEVGWMGDDTTPLTPLDLRFHQLDCSEETSGPAQHVWRRKGRWDAGSSAGRTTSVRATLAPSADETQPDLARRAVATCTTALLPPPRFAPHRAREAADWEARRRREESP
ncbi:hypothetical protein NKR23_g1759 [Pleurostoma richardsiae]|uniref:Uncharacterized protein n=1 Tax=Pleurostoma richardsiae TaxID=41990 RepID=A0AA38RP41_9PEZI|nr:hypothetical protein NKR23_g1759 [Pleurostoma richardsiae]